MKHSLSVIFNWYVGLCWCIRAEQLIQNIFEIAIGPRAISKLQFMCGSLLCPCLCVCVRLCTYLLVGKPELTGYNLCPLSADEVKAINHLLRRWHHRTDKPAARGRRGVGGGRLVQPPLESPMWEHGLQGGLQMWGNIWKNFIRIYTPLCASTLTFLCNQSWNKCSPVLPPFTLLEWHWGDVTEWSWCCIRHSRLPFWLVSTGWQHIL